MEFLQPLAVLDVALASAYVVHVAGVDQHYLNAARLEDLVDRDPVDPGRFERHGLDPALHQPLGQALKVGGEGAEFTHRLWIAAPRRNGWSRRSRCPRRRAACAPAARAPDAGAACC